MAEANKLRTARMVAGLTLTDFAKRVGVTASSVQAWEKGKASPTATRIPKIAKALNVAPITVLEMFTG